MIAVLEKKGIIFHNSFDLFLSQHAAALIAKMIGHVSEHKGYSTVITVSQHSSQIFVSGRLRIEA